MRNGVFRAYPVFCSYLSLVLFSSLSGYLLYVYRPSLYRPWYWTFEFTCVLVGYWVVLEIFEKGLARFPGARNLSRSGALIVFAVIVGYTTLQWVRERHSASLLTMVDVERNLRTAETVLLLGFLAIALYFAVPLGRNLKGIALGYGFYVAIEVIDHAARSYFGGSFHAAFSSVRAYSYLASLLIWAVALWACYPNPVSEGDHVPPIDYELLASKTRESLEAARTHLGKAGRR
ncbi:MAG TPA: hypothetical protein VLY23_18640 [Candidatus Acidoferrum sp.]|nr:hypothetical protein [Candidatus Acidoferrum sp.]